MSDQPGRESIEDDLGGSYSVDDEDQLQPEDTLVGDEDPLDSGYTAPDRPRGLQAFGTTAEEQAEEETIEQRIRQEVPDPDSAYGRPDNESGLDGPGADERIGGDHPDSIPASEDFLGDPDAAGETPAGRIVAPDEGTGEDTESDAVAAEEDATGGLSPEESAVYIADETATDDGTGPDGGRIDGIDGTTSRG